MEIAFDAEVAARVLSRFVRDEVAEAGLSRAVVGVSGGVDSAVSLLLSVRGLGSENVSAISMPYRTSSPSSVEHAQLVAEKAGCDFEVIDITEQIDTYFARFQDADRVRRGNKMARERMSILYDISARDGALVIGTSNKTEVLLGYGTIYGDAACGINPIGDLYKTQVRQLSTHMGVPDVIVQKPPSADLWVGQTDEEELGSTYDQMDQVLHRYVDLGWGIDELAADGFDRALVRRIDGLIRRSEFKRRLPRVARMPEETVHGGSGSSRDCGV